MTAQTARHGSLMRGNGSLLVSETNGVISPRDPRRGRRRRWQSLRHRRSASGERGRGQSEKRSSFRPRHRWVNRARPAAPAALAHGKLELRPWGPHRCRRRRDADVRKRWRACSSTTPSATPGANSRRLPEVRQLPIAGAVGDAIVVSTGAWWDTRGGHPAGSFCYSVEALTAQAGRRRQSLPLSLPRLRGVGAATRQLERLALAY